MSFTYVIIYKLNYGVIDNIILLLIILLNRIKEIFMVLFYNNNGN